MKSGIYGYFRLDGAPVGAPEALALGLDVSNLQAAAGAVLCGVDAAHPGAVSIESEHGDIFVLVGELDEMASLADSLNLSRLTPPATLARVMLERYGDDAPAKLLGEWTAAYWQSASRTLTLMSSSIRRDPLYYAVKGAHLAIAPNILTLKPLDWVDGRFDDAGLLFRLSKARVRRGLGTESVIRGAKAVEIGTVVRLKMASCHISRARAPEPATRYKGSFADAMAETEVLIRKIVRERLSRTGTAAFLISGGLDSSLLTWLGSVERRTDQKQILLTSAVAPGLGLRDETEFAQIVADHLGLAMDRVVPPLEPSIYRPLDSNFAAANGPLTSPRHYLYEAFHQAAIEHGARTIFDGCLGEFSLTGIFPVATARVIARHALDRLRSFHRPQAQGPQMLDTAFHVRLAPHRLAALPEALTASWHVPDVEPPWRRPDELWGYLPGSEKMARWETEVLSGQLRAQYPYRDPRLLKLFSGFPSRFIIHNGETRAPVRAILQQRLPDTIRLRRSKMPISPDYYLRLRTQADAAIARIETFKTSEAGDWIDLNWLRAALEDAARGQLSSPDAAFPMQITAHAAEFFNWWPDGRP